MNNPDSENLPLRAKAVDPVLKKSINFREVSPSGVVSADVVEDIIQNNQIGTIDDK